MTAVMKPSSHCAASRSVGPPKPFAWRKIQGFYQSTMANHHRVAAGNTKHAPDSRGRVGRSIADDNHLWPSGFNLLNHHTNPLPLCRLSVAIDLPPCVYTDPGHTSITTRPHHGHERCIIAHTSTYLSCDWDRTGGDCSGTYFTDSPRVSSRADPA